MISAETLEKLIAAGLEGQALIDVVRSIEADTTPKRSKGAERTARWRAKKKQEAQSVTSDVTSDVSRDVRDKKKNPPTPPLKKNIPPYSPPAGGRAPSYSDRFEAWWRLYPRKLNASKSKASEAFEKLSEPDKQLAEQALGPFRRSVAGEEERFIPHPITWLNQRRFETASRSEAQAGPEVWERRVRTFAATGRWPDDAGPKPGLPGCKAPDEIQTRHGYTPRPFSRSRVEAA